MKGIKMHLQGQTLTMSSVGQVTIPRAARKALELEPGDKLVMSMDEEGKTLTLRKQKTFDEVMGEIDRINTEHQAPELKLDYHETPLDETGMEWFDDGMGDAWV